MYPLNDKDLDRLSRDAAEHYDVESSASGWERLESRLDKELPVKEKDRKRFLFWLFFIALLSGGALVYMLGRTPAADNNLQASQAPESGNLGKVPAAEVSGADKKVTDNKNDISAQKKTSPAEENKANNQPADTEPANAKTNAVKTDAATTDAAGNDAAVSNKNTVSPKRRNAVTSKNNTNLQNRNRASIDKSTSSNRSRKQNNKPYVQTVTSEGPVITDVVSADQNSLKTAMPVIDEEKTYKAFDTEKLSRIPAPAPEDATAKKPAAKQNSSSLSKWEFGILTGPDFNNVKFKYNYKAGLNIGVTIGYRISDRWQVNTGLIYTKKWYKVAGEDFYPPKHSWLSYQDVQLVTGSCNMFEIPVNVRYDFSYNQKRRWFASTGVANYIMDKQYYDCDYINNLGERNKYPWSKDSNYNYIASNLNLSIGYERTIGKHFSIQAEPYFKVPLKGLGYGSIKMNSYGMFVTFKYKPGAKAKK